MRVYLIRHAIAFERDRKRWPDDRQRPLTPEGRIKFRKAAAGLRRLTRKVECVLTSPLTRARQTAEILTAVAGWPGALEVPELAPGRTVEQALTAIRERAAGEPQLKCLALVGHEPNLSELLAVSVAGSRARARFKIKKGGAACLFFPDARASQDRPERPDKAQPERARQAQAERPSQAQLEWLVTPKALRALARR